MGRILLAAIAGAIAMFVAMSILHMSPVSRIGFSQLADDGPALAALKAGTANRPGLYIYPTVDMQAKDAMAKSVAARAVKPSGIFVYEPPGTPGMSPRQLLTEFGIEFLQCLIAATLLSSAALMTYFGRVGFVLLTGILAALTTNASYWNWYGFPANYTLANMGIEVASFFAAALVIAAFIRPRRLR